MTKYCLKITDPNGEVETAENQDCFDKAKTEEYARDFNQTFNSKGWKAEVISVEDKGAFAE